MLKIQDAVNALRAANPRHWTRMITRSTVDGVTYACAYGVLAETAQTNEIDILSRSYLNELFGIPEPLGTALEEISDCYGFKAAAAFLENPESWKAGDWKKRSVDYYGRNFYSQEYNDEHPVSSVDLGFIRRIQRGDYN